MDKLKMHSPDLVDENIKKIEELFPNCITEDRYEQGRVKKSVDFDLLRQELSPHLVEGPAEHYTLSWPGKNASILAANAPVAKTLRPCEEESVNFENTQNLYIEGDNLDVLKLLQETYLGKVKMIYIDPPYNTGIPDIVGIDSDGNVCIIEMKNCPVDTAIIPQVLQYAFWAETNPDSVKSLWLECDDRPDDTLG